MAMVVFEDESVVTVMALLRLKEGHAAYEALNSIVSHLAIVPQIDHLHVFAVLSSIDGHCVGGYAQFQKEAKFSDLLHTPQLNLVVSELASISDCEVIQFSSIVSQPQNRLSPTITGGDLLGALIFTTEPHNQEHVFQVSQTQARANVEHVPGLKACSVHRSECGRRVICITYWIHPNYARAAATAPQWQEMAKQLQSFILASEKLIFEVVFVQSV